MSDIGKISKILDKYFKETPLPSKRDIVTFISKAKVVQKGLQDRFNEVDGRLATHQDLLLDQKKYVADLTRHKQEHKKYVDELTRQKHQLLSEFFELVTDIHNIAGALDMINELGKGEIPSFTSKYQEVDGVKEKIVLPRRPVYLPKTGNNRPRGGKEFLSSGRPPNTGNNKLKNHKLTFGKYKRVKDTSKVLLQRLGL